MDFEIYCDESRPDLFTTKASQKDKYLLIGGLWIPSNKRLEVKQNIKELKNKYKIGSQIKWQKVSRSRLEFYKQLVELFMFFDINLRFRCIIVDADKVDFKLFHDNDAELGFYKFYYELIHHWIDDFNEYLIFCDTKTNRRPDRLKILHQCLQHSNISSKIRAVQAIPSKESALIQLTDFLLGIVGSALNRNLSSTSTKAEIVDYLQQRLGRKLGPTPKGEQKFNIFKIRLQGGW